MDEASLDALIIEIKSYINFTWTDSEKDKRIKLFTKSSIDYLQEVAGTVIDFNEDYLAKDLLFNRVLYMDSQALDDFAKNYNSYLEELKIKYLEDDNA